MRDIAEITPVKPREIRVVQFGEGNFLRGFVDYMIDIANARGICDAGVAIVKAIEQGSLEAFARQNNLYTVLLRGRQEGRDVEDRRVVTCVREAMGCYEEYDRYRALARLDSLRVVVSNTTEAGIVFEGEARPTDDRPPRTFPGKLTLFLLERYEAFAGAPDKGLVLLPVELIEANGDKLRSCVLRYAALWNLPEGFAAWVREANLFCNTLVDRIITGYPAEEAQELWEKWGYRDELIVTGEPFALWVIGSADAARARAALPLDEAGLPVIFTDDIRPYRERKVRVLNGGHTGMVLGAYLAGMDTVGECMRDDDVRGFLERMIYEEIVPMVPLPEAEARAFAGDVLERFENPYTRHQLLSIALNSVSKWRARNLPSLLDYQKSCGELPDCLTFSFAALLAFYTSGRVADGRLEGMRGDAPYALLDDDAVLEFFGARLDMSARELARQTAQNSGMWGMDLSGIEGFAEKVAEDLEDIRTLGARAAMKKAANL